MGKPLLLDQVITRNKNEKFLSEVILNIRFSRMGNISLLHMWRLL